MTANETVREVCAEMRGMGNYQRFSGDHARELANRIEPAYEREMAVVVAERDAEIHRRAKIEREIKRMHDCCDALEDQFDAKDMEIARLEAALKPVMECDTDFDLCGAVECGEIELVSAPCDAVREAQRIMKKGESK